MNEKVYITGHRNPDSDSICSAIAYSEYKNLETNMKTVPVRLGKLNMETEFVLNYFGMKTPKLLETVRLSVGDLKYDVMEPIKSGTSLKIALDKMSRNNVTSMGVADKDGRLKGLVSISDIISTYIDVWDGNVLSQSGTTIENIIETIEADPLYIGGKLKENSKILVLAMEEESAKDYISPGDIAICGDRREMQSMALDLGVSLLIITGGLKIDKLIIEKAKEKNISIISTNYDTFMTTRVITQSIPVDYVMTKEDLVYFSKEDFVDDIKRTMSETRYRGYPVVNHDMKIKGMVSRYHLLSTNKKKVILVDHNERNQSVDGLEEATILEIIDHHRVADVFTGQPIYFRNEPVGSTATIIGSIMEENGFTPRKEIAGIMCAAIISDTLLLRSPTSTARDKYMLDRLSKIAGLDVEDFAMKMFKAGTSIGGKTPKELLNQDSKRYTVDDKTLLLSQVFTMDLESLEDMKEDLLEAMEKIKSNQNLELFILMFTDIFKEGSEMIVLGDAEDNVAKAYEKVLKDNSFFVPGVVSRKKQVVPLVTDILTNN